jgi:hypothetical protein
MVKNVLKAAILAIVLLVGSPCHALEWASAYGGKGWDEFRSVQPTSDGGYIVVGETNSFRDGHRDVWLVKLDEDGFVSWDTMIGGTTAQEDAKGWSVLQTVDGGFIVAGRIHDINTSSLDVLIVKLDTNGWITWGKTYGGTALDLVRSIDETSDGGYVVCGNTRSVLDNDHDYLVMKIDASGDVVWQKTYGTAEPEQGYAVRQTTDGGYIVAGRTEPDAFDFRNADAWVLKLYPDGQPSAGDRGAIAWQRKYDHRNGDQIHAIAQTSDGGFVMTGITNSLYRNSDSDDLWVVKLFSDGTIDWEKSYGGDGGDIGWDIQETSDGGFVVAGATATRCFSVGCADLWVLKLDSNGGIIWEKTHGGRFCDYAYAIQETADGGFIVTGDTASFGASNNSHDGVVLKLDANGDIPGCTAGRRTSATITDTVANVLSTGVLPGSLAFNAVDANLVSQVSAIQPREICYSPYVEEISPTFDSGRRLAGKTINVIGGNFGDTQGSSVIHINGKSFDATSPKIRIWTNTLIRIKTPNYDCVKFNAAGFIKRKVWVTVGGVDSSTLKFKLTKPESCP